MWKFSVSKSKIIKLDRMLHFLGNWVIQFAKYHSLEKFFNKINSLIKLIYVPKITKKCVALLLQKIKIL